MYFQITTRCNMTCAHCCFAANHKGDDMDRWTFIKALELAINFGEVITIGGGEPTTHKDFFQFLDKLMDAYNDGDLELPPHVVTNGKLVTKARKLLEYVENDYPVHVELSQDEWHDPIRPEIVSAFKQYQRNAEQNRYSYHRVEPQAHAGIRSVKRLMPVGRAADPARGLQVENEGCCCETMLVDPHGNIFSCGCKTHLLGNVHETDIQDILQGWEQEEAHTGGGLPVREFARLPLKAVA